MQFIRDRGESDADALCGWHDNVVIQISCASESSQTVLCVIQNMFLLRVNFLIRLNKS
jgi:hypothetical protein